MKIEELTKRSDVISATLLNQILHESMDTPRARETKRLMIKRANTADMRNEVFLKNEWSALNKIISPRMLMNLLLLDSIGRKVATNNKLGCALMLLNKTDKEILYLQKIINDSDATTKSSKAYISFTVKGIKLRLERLEASLSKPPTDYACLFVEINK